MDWWSHASAAAREFNYSIFQTHPNAMTLPQLGKPLIMSSSPWSQITQYFSRSQGTCCWTCMGLQQSAVCYWTVMPLFEECLNIVQKEEEKNKRQEMGTLINCIQNRTGYYLPNSELIMLFINTSIKLWRVLLTLLKVCYANTWKAGKIFEVQIFTGLTIWLRFSC